MALFECFAGSIVEKKAPRDEILNSEKYLLSSSNNSNINGICLDEGNYFWSDKVNKAVGEIEN